MKAKILNDPGFTVFVSLRRGISISKMYAEPCLNFMTRKFPTVKERFVSGKERSSQGTVSYIRRASSTINVVD
jgi:hypothetical protein